MKRFVEGEDRRQGILLPEYLDDFVSEENQARVIDGALVEAISIVGEARTAAIIESRRPRGLPSITGTGTDCIVVVAPCEGKPVSCAGLHTPVGEAIGATVYRATREGAEEWDAENAGAKLA